MDIKKLYKEIKIYNRKPSDLIKRAYDLSEKLHEGQLRKSGEPFVHHPLRVAFILAELKLDEVIIASALLHDIIEESDMSYDKLKKEFGKEIANLVEGVTKITKMRFSNREEYQAAAIRKMLIATTEDIRVIILKLADRLDNMRTLKYLDPMKRKRIARETQEIYAPLAYRLGLAKIKWELEDLSFKFLEPKIYQEFKNKISKKRQDREKDVKKIISIIKKEVKKIKVPIEISGRPKNFYSIYKKMLKKNLPFERIYDLLGLRILTKNVKQCYEILGLIHSLWRPIPGEFEDYIANPKNNMYQSIHTIIKIGKQNVEFQIRTDDMDHVAEEGVAAHWSYKGLKGDMKFEKGFGWLKQILSWKDKQGKDFLEALKVNLFGDNIFVLTPKGKIVELPIGSTPIDFAYAVHSDVGDKCVGVRINDNFVSLKHVLNNNDTVEIITNKNHKPSRDWLNIVKSDRARQRIRQSLKLYQNVPARRKTSVEESEHGLILVPLKFHDLKLAKCCEPLPGDKILGVGSKSGRVMIHKDKCTKLKNIGTQKKKINADWNEKIKSNATLKITSHDRIGMLADILNTIAATGKAVKEASARTIDRNVSECNVNVQFDSLTEMRDLIKRIRKIADVNKVNLVI